MLVLVIGALQVLVECQKFEFLSMRRLCLWDLADSCSCVSQFSLFSMLRFVIGTLQMLVRHTF